MNKLDAYQVAGLIVTILFGGGGMIAWFKLRGENTRVLVSAAEGAVLVQTNVIENLESQNKQRAADIAELRKDVERLQTELSKAQLVQQAYNALRLIHDEVVAERDQLRQKVREQNDHISELNSELIRVIRVVQKQDEGDSQ